MMKTEESAPLPRQPKLFQAAFVAIVLCVLAAIAGLLPRLRSRVALSAETRELAIPSVTVVRPVPGKATTGLLLPAEIAPWIEIPIYARASGYVKRWLTDLGARVEEGQLLAEIETPEIDQELARARYQLAESEAALALSKITSDRYTALLKAESVSEQDAAEKQADFAVKTATVSAARANVRRLEELKLFSSVTAPFAGIIKARGVDVGNLIAGGGGKELFRLAQTEKLRVFVRVPQTQALSITPGQQAELLIAEYRGRVFTGQVARTAGAIAPASRTLLIEIEVDNAQGTILAGSFGQVRLAQTQGDPPLTLPGNALLFRAEGPQVGLVLPEGTVELRSVTLGRDFGSTLEILGGVSATDQIILNPSDSLVSGADVRVVALTNSVAVRAGASKKN